VHPTTQPPAQLLVKPTATAATKSAEDKTESLQSPMANLSMKQAATEAASIGAARKGPTPGINDTKVAPLKSSLAEADAATKPETMNSSSDTKLESIQTAEDTAAQASNTPAPEKVEEPKTAPSSAPEKAEEGSSTTPSAEPSAVIESDDTSTTATPAGSIAQKHRGSSVSSADPETIKELEQSTAIPEEDDEDGVDDKDEKDEKDEKDDEDNKDDKADKDEEQPKTQDQEAAVAEKASVSVED
jgi:hypothetical protein